MAMTIQQIIEKFKNRYDQGYVYHTEYKSNFGNKVYVNTFTQKQSNGTTKVTAQTGLGIDCSGLQERWLLENGYNIPYLATSTVLDNSFALDVQ